MTLKREGVTNWLQSVLIFQSNRYINSEIFIDMWALPHSIANNGDHFRVLSGELHPLVVILAEALACEFGIRSIAQLL